MGTLSVIVSWLIQRLPKYACFAHSSSPTMQQRQQLKRERERAKPFRTHSMQPGSRFVHSAHIDFAQKAKNKVNRMKSGQSEPECPFRVSQDGDRKYFDPFSFGLCRHGISPLGSAAAEGGRGGTIRAVLPSGLSNAFFKRKNCIFPNKAFSFV